MEAIEDTEVPLDQLQLATTHINHHGYRVFDSSSPKDIQTAPPLTTL
jgi:hypothetical protein